MAPRDRNAAIAAAIFLVGFALVAYFLPVIMLWLGDRSLYAAFGFGAIFLLAPFIVLWLRGRSQRGGRG